MPYCSQTDLEKKLSQTGADLRLDDDPTAIDEVLEEADSTIEEAVYYLYSAASLATNNWVRDRARDIAMYLLCTRRGNLPPAPVQAAYERTLAWLMAKFGMPEKAAMGRAAQIAWAKLKAMGAHTKLDVLGGRKVDVLRDTGELLASFSPGIGDQVSNADGQIVRLKPGEITVGTNKKPWHHKTRPFWPADGNLPQSWWNSMQEEAAGGIQDAVVTLLRGAA